MNKVDLMKVFVNIDDNKDAFMEEGITTLFVVSDDTSMVITGAGDKEEMDGVIIRTIIEYFKSEIEEYNIEVFAENMKQAIIDAYFINTMED